MTMTHCKRTPFALGSAVALAALGLLSSTAAFAFQAETKTVEIPLSARAELVNQKPQDKPADAPAAGAPAAPGAQPRAVVVESESFDFGTTWAGDPLSLNHTFVIKNEGEAALEILSVKPACGCTAAGKTPTRIEPGQSGEFPFSLNSTKIHGVYSKSIAITTNDPAKPKIDLKLTGTCKAFIEVTPQGAFFPKLFGDEPAQMTLKIVNNTEEPLTLTMPPAKDKAMFSYELIETTPGKAYDLIVRGTPPFAEGTVRDNLEIGTNLIKQPKLAVAVTGRVPKRLDVNPPQLVLSKASRESTRPLIFRNEGKRPVRLLSATASDPTLGSDIPVVEKTAGVEYMVNLTIPANYTPPAGTKVTLKTDDEQQPEITVPVTERPTPTPQLKGPDLMVGKPAPAFNLTTTDGKAVGGEALKDVVTVLDFFAVNCGFCKKQMPRLEPLRKEFEGKPVRFVAVQQTMRQPFTEAQVKETLSSIGFNGEIALDPENKVGPMFGASSFPSLLVVGKDGMVVASRVGNIPDLEARLKTDIETELDPAKAAAHRENLRKNPPAATPPAAPQKRPQELMVGKPVPQFSAVTVDGRPFGGEANKDVVTVVDFFAVNCGFCKKQMPRLEPLRKEYEGKPVRFVAVQQTMRQPFSQEQVMETIKSIGFNGEVVLDPENKIGPMFSASSFPSLFVVGKDGTIASSRIGNIADLEKVLKEDIETQLDPAKAAAHREKILKEAQANAAAPTPAGAPVIQTGAGKNVPMQRVNVEDLPPELLERIKAQEAGQTDEKKKDGK
jgi:thiol-disulfide isomerase/thioredoxin